MRLWSLLLAAAALAAAQTLPGTTPLTGSGDPALEMVEGIARYLERDLARPAAGQGTRERFRQIIGLKDARVAHPVPELLATVERSAQVAPGVEAVRWPVLPGVDAEGLLVQRKGVDGNGILIPDADQTPEQAVAACGLAAERVLVPTIIDRRDTWSGRPGVRLTNQPHREFLYRMAFPAGRHIIGYEVQKVLAAVDWFAAAYPGAPIRVHGCGEGGLLALYSAAADERITEVTVSGYFGPRSGIAREPIYRNVWNLLPEFADAQLARLIAPRPLRVFTRWGTGALPTGAPPPEQPGRRGAAPGAITYPTAAEARAEAARAGTPNITVTDGAPPPGGPAIPARDPDERQHRQFTQLVDFTQRIIRESEAVRARAFAPAAAASTPAAWDAAMAPYRDRFARDLIGRLDPPSGVPAAATRRLYDTPLFTGYEVRLPVVDEVFAYGILLIPKNLRPGERRPLVVAQHGLEARPQDLIAPDTTVQAATYQRFAARLAEEGFLVYAPQNPYIHGDKFRVLSRLGNPVGKTLYSFIVAQHRKTLDWLETLPQVDPARIGYYGLSYGGRTAVRVPPLEPRYKVVVCSGNFNEWIAKLTTLDHPFSYIFTGEYEIFEFDLADTFNYYEAAALIAPRPFFVERGHSDGVGLDEWVSYEYAKVAHLYARLHLDEAAAIEFFNGPHQIWGAGAFAFLHRHLQWP